MPDRDFEFLISGEWRTSREKIEIRSPYDGEVVGCTYLAGDKDIEDAIHAAASAFEESRRLPTYKRAELLKKTADAIRSQSEELARLIALEAGKPIRAARMQAHPGGVAATRSGPNFRRALCCCAAVSIGSGFGNHAL